MVATESQKSSIALFSAITIGSALIIFILILVNQFGPFNILSKSDNPFVKPKIALLLSTYNFDYYQSNQQNYQQIIDQWYTTLKEQNIKPILLNDKDLENEKKLDSDILILPSVVCMSDRQISSVKKFVKKGGGLIISWAAGARRKNGAWRGWDFIEEMTGIRIIKMDEKNPPKIDFLTINSHSPVTVGFPSGLRINLRQETSEIFARSIKNRTDAFYSDWRLYPISSEKGYPPYTAITHEYYGKGKVLWLSFNTNRLLVTRENSFFLTKLVTNSIKWMFNHPLGTIDDWPYGHKTAFLIDQDTEHEYKNTARLVSILTEENVPATLFCISGIFEKDTQYLKELPKSVEIGSHLDSAQTLANQSYSMQYGRIKKSRDVLARITGKKVLGLKPPEEIFDNSTIKVLMELGFKYMIGNPNTPVNVPTIITKESIPKDVIKLEHLISPPKGDFVLLPRIAHDDYYIMVREKILEHEKILSVLQADFQNIYNLGGLYIFAFHTQLLSTEKYAAIIKEMIRYAKSHNAWIVPGDALAEWWTARSNIEQKVSMLKDGKFRIKVTSKNAKDPVKNFGLTYYLPEIPKRVSVIDTGTGEKLGHKYSPPSKSVNIRIPEIKPHGTIEVEVRLD